MSVYCACKKKIGAWGTVAVTNYFPNVTTTCKASRSLLEEIIFSTFGNDCTKRTAR